MIAPDGGKSSGNAKLPAFYEARVAASRREIGKFIRSSLSIEGSNAINESTKRNGCEEGQTGGLCEGSYLKVNSTLEKVLNKL